MNYNNYVVLYGNNVYCHCKNKNVVIKYKNSTLDKGKIMDEEDFVKTYIKVLKQNKISSFFFNKRLLVIYDNLISKNDISKIKNTFHTLNYGSIVFKSDVSFISMNKKDNYLIANKLLYVDEYNTKKILPLDKNLTNHEMRVIIQNRSANKNLFIIGNYNNELIGNINYYIYDSIFDFFSHFLNIDK